MGWVDKPPSYIHLPGARHHLIDELGEGFLCGITYGSIHHFLRGLRHSPTSDHRLAGGFRAVGANAPRVAGSWAAFWGLWCAFKSAAFLARRCKDDPWNDIAGFAAASAFVELRRGARVAARAGICGAVVAALFEGVNIVCNRHVAPAVKRPPPAAVKVPAVRSPTPAAVDDVVPAAARAAAPSVDPLGRPFGTLRPLYASPVAYWGSRGGGPML